MRVTLLSLVFATLTLPLTAGLSLASDGPKLAVVDLQRALNEVEEGKTARQNLEQRYEKSRLQLEQEKTAVEQMQQDLEAQRAILSDSVVREKEAELQGKMLQFQQRVMENQQQMALMEQELTGDLLKKLYGVAGSVAAAGGYNLVVEASAVVYVNGTTDITDQLIARYNSKKD